MKNIKTPSGEKRTDGDKNKVILEIVKKIDENNVPVIPIGCDLNTLSSEKEKNEISLPVKDKINDFKTPMRKEVEKFGTLNRILEILGPIDFEYFVYGNDYQNLQIDYKSASNLNEKNEIKSMLDEMTIKFEEKMVIIIENLLAVSESIGLSLGYQNYKIYLFNGQLWEEMGYEPLIKEFLVMVAEISGLDPYSVRQHQTKQKLLDEFKSTCSIPEKSSKRSNVKINFLNGTYVFHEGKIREHRKDDYLFYCLNFKYEPDAVTRHWQDFINKVLPDKTCQTVLLEFIGYIFLNFSLSKALILLGSGANGKSVVNTIVSKLVGEENMTGYTLQSLCDSSGYTRAVLDGALVNYSDEIGNGKYDQDKWKKLVSGGAIEARLPYKEPFMFNNNCKFIFNANTLPIAESTHGFFRRMIIIPFDVTISEDEQNVDLADDICKTDLPGIFNLVLEKMKCLVEEKRFSKSSVIDAVLKRYKTESNSVAMFVEDEQWIRSSVNPYRLNALYEKFKEYCIDSGYHTCSSKKLSDRLRQLGFEVSRGTNGYYFVHCQKKELTPPTSKEFSILDLK